MPIGISTASPLPDATRDLAYSQALTGTGATAPYTFALESGDLPPAFSLSAAGVISGTSTGSGVYNFVARVTDSLAETTTKAFAVSVLAASHFASATQLTECESMIKYILNACDTWGGAVNDARRMAEAVTKSRIFGTLEVIKAIAKNQQHGYWGVLASLVAVQNDAFLPFHLGQHGIPLIQPFPTVAAVAAAGSWRFSRNPADSETIDVNGVTWIFVELLTVGPPNQIEIQPTQEGTATAFAALLNNSEDADIEVATYANPSPGIVTGTYDTPGVAGNAFTMENSSGGAVSVLGATNFTGGADESPATYRAGQKADPDEIDSYRNDSLGLHSPNAHNAADENGMPSELSMLWSIVNSQAKFTGYACNIPLIQFYEADCATKTPMAYLPTILKLAPLWNLKEGDNLVGIAGTLVNAGQEDLRAIESGAMSVSPVSDLMEVQKEL